MNIMNMMKQAQAMQAKMQDLQAKMAQVETEGQAGGGAVKVVLTGKGEARSVKLDPSVVNAADVEMLEDLIVAAINDAKSKSDTLAQAEMKQAMGGINLPAGLQLPF